MTNQTRKVLPPHLVLTRNAILLMELVERLMALPTNADRMGTFHGPSGYGKSKAICCTAMISNALYLEMRSVFTPKSLLETLMPLVGLQAKGTTATMFKNFCSMFSKAKRPLIFDDVDKILHKESVVQLMRDFHDATGGVIIWAGEELLPQKLTAWENVHGRMADWLPAEPATVEDARQFCSWYCRDVAVAEDLLDDIVDAAQGSARRVCNNLSRVREFAQRAGLDAITAAQYNGGFFTGEPPEQRKFQ